MKKQIVTFKHCVVIIDHDKQLVRTIFHADRTEAHACPHDTPEYRAHSMEKGAARGRIAELTFC